MIEKSKCLALFGGEKIVQDHSSLRIKWPIVSEEDKEAVIKSFDDYDFSGRGSEEVYLLEKEMANFFGMPYATALNSGTAALHAALVSLDINEDDEVIVPNLTFIATALAVVHNKSIPVFADVDPYTYNITADNIEAVITPKTKAVVIVHMHGIPADMDPIIDICKKYHLYMIEDVAQAPGATYKGKLVGSFGDASTFSLMSQKNLATCGECGMLLNKTIVQKNKAEMLRIYGEVIKSNETRVYNSITFGWNYTLNPIQASMARTQLRSFTSLTNRIRIAGEFLNKTLSKFDWLTPPYNNEDFRSVFHFYRIMLDPTRIGYADRGRFRMAVQHALNAEGLNVRHYQTVPVSEQPVFKNKIRGLNLPPKENFPCTLHIIRSSLIIGAIGSTPSYLLCDGTSQLYFRGIEKINNNMDLLLSYASSLDYREPWEDVPVISDSFGAEYINASI
ncbi:DegT/DnrJ/EryC1/StrS family aminotransferase [Xenorhabdus khoisanae]|uniref:DegT/DnrJ/EryC1/StrS family aminotransferase n=1 Tax=Xenorhabdus khoisanae TaxID=880157 RepID=UPI00069F3097|nr:DegT/DnrJ/EryC1/StrS family aminotransferase [Xenorhabdus khoisanae]